MRDLFSGMEQKGDAVAPLALLTQLRVLAPQFAEVDERSGGFAQQGQFAVQTPLIFRCRRSVDSNCVRVTCSTTDLIRTLFFHR